MILIKADSLPIPVLTRDHEPTEGQIKAGNYRKPKRRFAGLDVSIENPAGSYRRGQDRAGKTWETRMLYDYGYIRGSLGVDGDHVDCYLGPNEDAPMAYIVHQRCYGDWDKFDEDKCMLGFDSQEDAEAAYLKHYDDPRFLGPVTAMPMDEFRAKVRATKEAPQMIKAMPLILKAYVRAHTRKLGSGKVIQVRGYTDKRVKKPTAASNDKQLSFNLEDTYDGIETREGTTDQQIELGKAAVKSLAQSIVGMRHSGEQAPTLLGVRLVKGFTEKGNVNLVGQKIGSPDDLAALAQVYRDPRFETFRMIYTKRGRVVGETAYSSRLPGSVSFHHDIEDEVKRDKEGFGADGYYMLHNHPSGSATPSNADKLFTKAIASAVPGFKTHVVIDHNEYGIIDSHGDDSVVQDEALGGIDFHGDPSLDHDLLGMSVTDPDSAAVLGKRLEALGQAEAPVLVMTQGRRAEVSLIASVPSATIRSLSEKGGETKARAWLRRVGSKTGSGSNIFLSVSDTDMERLSGELRHLVVSGLVTDVVSSSGVSLRALRIHPHERDPFSYSPRMARRVLVGAKGGPLRKALPLILKAHVKQHTRTLPSGKVVVVRAHQDKRQAAKKDIPVTETPEFKRWFGDSKVVDEDGEPLVVYHGTGEKFHTFDQDKRGSVWSDKASRSGFFFAESREDAVHFPTQSGSETPVVMDVYLVIENPVVITDEDLAKATDEWLSELEQSNPDEYEYQVSTRAWESQNDINPILEDLILKHVNSPRADGVIVELEGMERWFVVPKAEQIKSATGNNGMN